MRHASFSESAAACCARLREIAPARIEGRILGLTGLMVDVAGLSGLVSVGDRLIADIT